MQIINYYNSSIIFIYLLISLRWPREVYGLYYSVGLQPVDFNGIGFKICLVLNYSNCCVYPFIYLIKYEEFQKGVLSLIGRKKPATVQDGQVAGQAANN
jgi:hypothetical protein